MVKTALLSLVLWTSELVMGWVLKRRARAAGPLPEGRGAGPGLDPLPNNPKQYYFSKIHQI